MSDLSKKITEKIEKEHIEQSPGWIFNVQNILFWSLYIISIIIGGKALAFTLHVLQRSEVFAVARSQGADLSILRLIPTFWIILFILFLIVALLGFHKTRKGYTYEAWKLVAANLLFTGLLALILFMTSVPARLDPVYGISNAYDDVSERRALFWTDVRHGRLSGEIRDVLQDIVEIEDVKEMRWTIFFDKDDLCGDVQMVQGEYIRIIGSAEERGVFNAHVIMPWSESDAHDCHRAARIRRAGE